MPNQVPATEQGILNGEPESQTGADSSTGDEKSDSGKKEEGGSKEEKAFKYWQSQHDKLDRETKELRELRELVGGEETLKAGAQIALWAKKNPEEFRRFQEFLANPNHSKDAVEDQAAELLDDPSLSGEQRKSLKKLIDGVVQRAEKASDRKYGEKLSSLEQKLASLEGSVGSTLDDSAVAKIANLKQEFPAELVEKYQSEMKKVLRDRTVTALEAFKRVATWEDLKIALDDKNKRPVEKAKGASSDGRGSGAKPSSSPSTGKYRDIRQTVSEIGQKLLGKHGLS